MKIEYTVSCQNAHAHLIDVCLRLEDVSVPALQFSLPSWIPGSYLIRDFAKNIIGMNAWDGHKNRLKLTSLDSSHWRIECDELEVMEVHYQVYAWDLSVRSAHFDQTHAFFNGTSVFLRVDGYENQLCHVKLKKTAFIDELGWRVATTLPKISVDDNGYGNYQASDYRELIEYPVEMGDFLELSFEAKGLLHRIVFTGKFECDKLNRQQLLNDLKAICETELELFGAPYPFEEYLFQVMVTRDGYGGLEHINSTALMCSRNDLPYLSDNKRSDSYLQFLELCAHEYFHSWNVKRIQPEVYQTTDLSTPVYTNQLWWFEGITSYVDGLFLNLSGMIDDKTYLNRLSKEMTRVYRMPGRFKQSVAESSWHTWTKFYQQDENAPNAIISYYSKGSLIALGLDLLIRYKTDDQASLFDILKRLWHEYGIPRVGLKDGELEQICSEIAGYDLTEFFQKHLFGTEDLPFESLFAPFGVDFRLRPATGLSDTGGSTDTTDFPVQLGANLIDTEHQTIKVTHVWNERSLANAGIAANDEIIALNGYKMDSISVLEKFLSRCVVGDKLQCHFFRRDELMQAEIHLNNFVSDRVLLEINQQYASALPWLQKPIE